MSARTAKALSKNRLQWDFETAQYFVSPLADLTSPRAKVVALSILKSGWTSVTVGAAQRAAAMAGVPLSHAETLERVKKALKQDSGLLFRDAV